MQLPPRDPPQRYHAVAVVRALLLLVWAAASFGVTFFARDLNQVLAGWPVNFWWAAQGGVLVFLAVVMLYAWFANRVGLDEPDDATVPPEIPADGDGC